MKGREKTGKTIGRDKVKPLTRAKTLSSLTEATKGNDHRTRKKWRGEDEGREAGGEPIPGVLLKISHTVLATSGPWEVARQDMIPLRNKKCSKEGPARTSGMSLINDQGTDIPSGEKGVSSKKGKRRDRGKALKREKVGCLRGHEGPDTGRAKYEKNWIGGTTQEGHPSKKQILLLTLRDGKGLGGIPGIWLVRCLH